jgi:hypothetical protein
MLAKHSYWLFSVDKILSMDLFIFYIKGKLLIAKNLFFLGGFTGD